MGLGLLGALGGVGEGMAQIGMQNLKQQAAIDYEKEMSSIRQERELALEETKYNRGRQRAEAEAKQVKGLVDTDMAELEANGSVSADQAGPSYKASARDRIESDIRRRRELGLDTRDSLAELDRVDRSEQHQDSRTQNDRKFELDKQNADRAAVMEEAKIKAQQRANEIAAGNAARQNKLTDLQIKEANRKELEAEQERGLKRGLIDFQRRGDTESANIYKQELSLLGKNPDALSAKEKELLSEGYIEEAKALEKRANDAGPTEEGKALQERADRAWERSRSVVGQSGGRPEKAGSAPYAEGQEIVNKRDGKTYVVQGGVPVLKGGSATPPPASAPAAPRQAATPQQTGDEFAVMLKDAQRGGATGRQYIQSMIANGEVFSEQQRRELRAAGFQI